MIDLRDNELPLGIHSGGNFYELDTDFRTWIKFDHDLQYNHVAGSYIFKGKLPPDGEESLNAVLEFYKADEVTPQSDGSSNARAIDLVLDGSYIVASFQQAYGIDLTSIDYMHWHMFQALLHGLPEDTILSRAISYRTYKKDSRKHDDVMASLRRKWTLPAIVDEQEQAEMLEWAEGLGL